ncbi:hypothetical protein H311_03046 [Anncaliia algerae PRA109]|nr:hypothetical protein H311_03046 [Anncaliia algerae PRA109]
MKNGNKINYDKNLPTLEEETENVVFNFQIPETNLVFQKKLNYLRNINQNFIHWIKKFRDTAKDCNWNHSTILSVLKNIVDHELLTKLQKTDSADAILDGLLKLKYPESDSNYYLQRLNKLKQENFVLISEYHDAITSLLKRYSITVNLSKSEMTFKEKEIFNHGLHKKCLLRMAEDNCFGIIEILKKIKSVEELMLQFGEETKEKKTHINT